MSLYQYINGINGSEMYQYPDLRYNVEQDYLNPKCQYLSREGRHNCNMEWDYSNPKYVDWSMHPPTFIIQDVSIDMEKLHDYIVELLSEHSAQFADQITSIVVERMQNHIDSSLQDSVAAAFAEIGIISEEEINTITEN